MKREYVPGIRRPSLGSSRPFPSSERPPGGEERRPPPPPRPVEAKPPPLAPKPPSRTEFVLKLTPAMSERINALLDTVPETGRMGTITSLLDVGLAQRDSKKAGVSGADARFGIRFCERLVEQLEADGAPKTIEHLKTKIAEMKDGVKEVDSNEARWTQFIRLAELLALDERVPADRRTIAAEVRARTVLPSRGEAKS